MTGQTLCEFCEMIFNSNEKVMQMEICEIWLRTCPERALHTQLTRTKIQVIKTYGKEHKINFW